MVVLPFVERGSLSDVISEDTLQGVEFIWIVRLIAHHCTRFVHPIPQRFPESVVVWHTFIQESPLFFTAIFIQ